MAFIVTLIALLVERFFDWSHIRNWSWFATLQEKVASKFSGKPPEWLLAISVIPVLLVVGVLQLALRDVLYGFLQLIFDTVILLYCMGPRNLWADTFASINALTQGDGKAAAERLKTTFKLTDMSFAQSVHKQLVDQIFIQSNQRLVGVVFFFVILGPVGAVLYRLIAQAAQINFSTQAVASKAEALLDWLPVRLFTFLFALGGNFSKVFAVWSKNFVSGLTANQVLLMDCGLAALGFGAEDHLAEDGSLEQQSISLIDRSFIILLVFVLLYVSVSTF